mgnify:CR=1 FL=1
MKIRSIAEAKKKIKIGSKVMITTQKACAKDSFGAVKTGSRDKRLLLAFMSILSMCSWRAEYVRA